MKNLCLVLIFLGVLQACTGKRAAPVVSDDEQINNLTMDSLFEDTTKVLNVYLPTMVDTVNKILIHEIGVSTRRDLNASYISRKEKYDKSVIINLVFEDLVHQKSYLLTNNQVRISSYDMNECLKRNIGRGYILYRVIDKDYNKDGVLNSQDIESIYISNMDGTSFSKITKDKENTRSDKWVYPLNRYYFETLEDSNKDGYFDSRDKGHYYYIEFDKESYKVVEYNPLDILNK